MGCDKPSWMCRVCQEQFHSVCLNQQTSDMGYGYHLDHSNDADNPLMKTNCGQIDIHERNDPDR